MLRNGLNDGASAESPRNPLWLLGRMVGILVALAGCDGDHSAAAFMDVPQFIERIDSMIDQITSSRKRPGATEILVPGERSARVTAENLKRGVKLDAATLAELRQLAQEYGVAFPEKQHA